MEKRKILFSPPDISQAEIDEVVDTLKSGWITTGPKTKLFETKLSEYCGTPKTVCLNSATAAMELVLRLFDIGPGDEVITSVYTYTASASVILHCGATPVLVDVKPGEFNIDSEKIEKAITERTKAIIPVDIGGMPVDFDEIFEIIERNRDKFNPQKGTYQEKLGRILLLSDAAHSLGAKYKGKMIGNVADFTSFSFHAVKNLTTAEGGAITWRENPNFDNEEIYKEIMLLALHGQNKDALAKLKPGSWEYDIVMPGYKCNMTDINSAIGLAQLRRYDSEILAKKEQIIKWYEENLRNTKELELPKFETVDRKSSLHLYMIRIKGVDSEKRNEIIQKLAEEGVSTNVHFQPLPLLTAYKNIGLKIEDYPEAYKMHENQISLPLHNFVTEEDVKYIANILKEVLS
ncbi:DegT/DnrJ/EryC1/StrS family aminotransferase [Cetobacterium sp.]|uniref:DegT/DnrJ/EryC1/StrS family aminotransferase n=1 Tax=Cetobacterium sp. TaxID=2071632 RepID=UPI003EE4F0F4